MRADMRAIRDWLAQGRLILEGTQGKCKGMLRVQLSDDAGHLALFQLPEDDEGCHTPGVPCLALSPIERDIVRALGTGVLSAKAIASRIARPYDSSLRVILANLCDRQPPVLLSSQAGYRLAIQSSEPCQIPSLTPISNLTSQMELTDGMMSDP